MYKDDGTDIDLALCCSWYMDCLGIKRLWESCRMDDPYSPQHAIFIDGPYTFFKFKDKPTPLLSDDGSREFLQEHEKVTVVDYPGYQVDKRMQYVKKAEELGCDAIVIIDSDEYLHPEYNDWKEFRSWLKRYSHSHDPLNRGFVFNLLFWVDEHYEKAYNCIETGKFERMPRVWHRPEKLEYYSGVHYWVRHREFVDPHEKLGSTLVDINHGIRLAQDSHLRRKDFQKSRDIWAKLGMKYEDNMIKEFTTTHNLEYFSVYQSVFGKKIRNNPTPKNINPLLAIMVNHYNNEVIDHMKKIINVDKIYLDGFESKLEALKRARLFFLKNELYSHLIIASDLYDIQRSDVNELIDNMVDNLDVVSGWSSLGRECTFSVSEVHFLEKNRQWNRATPRTVSHMKPNPYGLIEIKYTDLVLAGIPRIIVEKTRFDEFLDIGFSWDVTHTGYMMYIDPTIIVPKISNNFRYTSNPTLIFEKHQVEIDDFMR